MALRSPKSPKFRKFAPASQNSGLPLPFEIRDQIFTYLLVSTKEVLELKQGLWPLYRCGSEYIQSTTGGAVSHINDPQISKQFRTLTQVSHQIRYDAITVLFYRNKWNLVISLCREVRSRQASGWDSSSMVRKLWGQETILSIRYLKITFENENKNAQKRMQSHLHRLVKILSSSRNLRRLEVEWLDHSSIDPGQCTWGWKRAYEKEKIREVSRKADGSRESKKHFRNGVSRWEEGQKILKPLEGLRSIPEAVVTGCVTDKWAEHLEKCMKSHRPAAVAFGEKRASKKKAQVQTVAPSLSP